MQEDLHANCVPRAEFERVVSELRAENEALRKLVEGLQNKLARYEGPHAPPSSRHTRYPGREPSGNPPGKPKGSNGATRKLEHLTPDETIPVKPEKCRKCSTKLGEPVGWINRRVQEVPEPRPAKLHEFRKGVCICPNCGAENIGTDSRCPVKGDFGPRALALVSELRFRERFSIAMVQAFLRERHNVDISSAAILDMTSRAASALRTAHNQLAMRIRRSVVVYVDETGFYINGRRVWLWIFVTAQDVLVVIDSSRSSKVPRRILTREYSGTVVSDCYSAYDLLKKHLRKARFQKCWAHLLREAKACAQHCESEEGKDLYAELCDFYSRMKAFLDSSPNPEGRAGEFMYALERLDKLISREVEEPRVQRLLNRLRKHREDWFTCIAIAGVEPTNNRAERALRPQVILRRLRGSLRSERGKEDHEVLASHMASWEARGLNPALQLEHELSRIFAEGSSL